MQQHTTPRGLFISLEGIDGAGKSTHMQPLADAFIRQGRVVRCTREPGGTPLAENLRQLVLHEEQDALTEALLVFAARRDHVQQLIAPALARGEVVLCDRFADATFAYQGAGRGFDWETLRILEHMVLARPDHSVTGHKAQREESTLLQPDLTLWFDVPAAVAAARLKDARTPDKFEAESEAFFERVSQGYARRAAENRHRFVRVDAAQTPDAVWRQVQAAIDAKGWL